MAGLAGGCTVEVGSSKTSKTVSHGPPRLILNAAKDSTEGKWEAELPKRKREEAIILEFREGRQTRSYWLHRVDVPLSATREGEPRSVEFGIGGEAGTLRFNGILDGRSGYGMYRFQPNETYADEAGTLLKDELTTADLMELSLADVALSYIRDLKELGLEVGLGDVLKLKRHNLDTATVKSYTALGFGIDPLLRLRNYGIKPDFIASAREHGFGKTTDELIKLRNYGISPDQIADWKKAGFDLSLDELIKMRNQGISPGYAAAWRAVDQGVTYDEMIRMRNHGVTPEYVKAWRSAGYEFDFDELARARNYGVTHEFASAIKEAGFTPSLDEIIRMRQHGITGEYFQAMKHVNADWTPDQLTRLRQHGVTPEYARGMREAGYKFEVDELVKLRNYGVSVEYATALKVPGRANLDAAAIVELRQRGVSAETARKLRE